MRVTRKLITSSVIAAGGAVAIALTCSATAAAEPAPAPAPPPGIPFMDQLATAAANAPTILQSAAAALGGTNATPAVPVAPPPAASASITVPQPGLPTGVPPATAPVIKQPGTVLPGMPAPAVPVPTAEATLPHVPGSPVPQQVSFPGDLAALLPAAGNSLTNLMPSGATEPGAAAPAGPILPAGLFPTSALP